MKSNDLNRKITMSIDIGTSKICAVAGFLNEFGRLEVVGVGSVESQGVTRGVISNIEKTEKGIIEAIEACIRNTQYPVKDVHVGISGYQIKSEYNRGILTRDNNLVEINKDDIERLYNDMYKLPLDAGGKILHLIPQEYTVDNEKGIHDPIGMCGARLDANFLIISGQITSVSNINRCCEKAGLNVKSITLNPIASAEAVLTKEEKEAGVIMIDIGAGTTEVAIFHEGILKHTFVLPLGGNLITKDIKEGVNAMLNQAEKLKVKFGSAIANEAHANKFITFEGVNQKDVKEISHISLAKIIQSRVIEILEFTFEEIRRLHFTKKTVSSIVLTGGTAGLPHLDSLCEYISTLPTRVGTPVRNYANGYSKALDNPKFSTAMGLLIKALNENKKLELEIQQTEPVQIVTKQEVKENTEQLVTETAESSEGFFERMFRRAKNWLEDEPDTNF